MGYRDLVYRLYERRLESSLTGKTMPRHVGVMTDGNRRWARSAGHTDVSKGHKKGADKIFELLAWCKQAGVEVVTLWLLSTGTGLAPFMSIIKDPDIYDRYERVVLTHTCRFVDELAYKEYITDHLPAHEHLGELEIGRAHV